MYWNLSNYIYQNYESSEGVFEIQIADKLQLRLHAPFPPISLVGNRPKTDSANLSYDYYNSIIITQCYHYWIKDTCYKTLICR